MDAAEMPSAWLWGVSEGGPMSVVAAASHPERVEGIILCNSGATLVDADESPEDRAGRREMWELFLERWGTEQSITLDVFAPSIARDESYRRWQPRYERRSASPGALRELLEMHERIDVRAVAPTVSVPTLVVHRVGDRVQPIASGRKLASLIPGATFVELPGDDHFDHIGDVDALLGEIQRFVTGGAGARNATRVLASVVFTDMVASTERASSLGDGRWRAFVDAHEAAAREVVGAHGGRYVKWTGDGTLAWFDSPSRAINATGELLERASGVGLTLRAGIHAGEIELFGDDVTGIGVNIAARILSTAAPGEVLVSRTVRDLVTGSTHRFEDKGEHELKGIEDSWQLFAVV